MRDPFLIEGPACISFSGGRTSGYMLWRILQAHQWVLPDDVKVIFANTGKEMPETLDFVRDCSVHWNVPIVWVEYEPRKVESARWRVVDYDSAARGGEPYSGLIHNKGYLPNPVTRFCTIELKIRPIKRYCQALGWTHFTMLLGLRADEQRRVAKLAVPVKEVFDRAAPLAESGIVVSDIGNFWTAQPFDLRLPNMNGKTMHGNCDLCFLKGANQILALVRENPERAKWWVSMEALALASKPSGAVFRSDRPSYASMHRMATQHGELFPFGDEPLQDCMCTD